MDEQNNNTSDDQTEDKFKDFLEIYQIYRDHVKHEDTLGNQRLSFFIASQSFLFFPYFNILKDYQRHGYNGFDTFLLIVICVLGWWVSHLVEPSIKGFVSASHNINLIWKRHYLAKLNQETNDFYKCESGTEANKETEANKNGLLFFLGRLFYCEVISYPENTTLRSIVNNQEINNNSNNKKIEESPNLSFLSINQITIPNIRHENNNKQLRDNVDNFTNKIPHWFKLIWIVLLIISLIFNFCHTNPTETTKIEFSEQSNKDIEKILNQTQTYFLNQLQQEFNNKEEQGFKQGTKETIKIIVKNSFNQEEEIHKSNNFDKIINKLAEFPTEEAVAYITTSKSFSELGNKLKIE